MREYEVNTRVTAGGSHVFSLKGVSSYSRKEPFTISDIIYEVLEQTWPYRKYNVVMNTAPHDALSRRLEACAKHPIDDADVTWVYCHSKWVGHYIDFKPLGDEDVDESVTLDGGREIDQANMLLNTTGINLTCFNWEEK